MPSPSPAVPVTASGNPLDAKDYDGKPAAPVDVMGRQPPYSAEDSVYLDGFLQARLQRAKQQYAIGWPILNGKTPQEIYDENEKIANTILPGKKNDDDVIVSMGTIEAKLDALLSNIANLDLECDVFAFDRANNPLNELATAMGDTIKLTEEHDGNDEGGDEEKKLLRQRELLKQGTVYVQEEWMRLFETKKKLSEDYNGQFLDWDKWSESLEMIFEGPGRTLLHGMNVFLGDITQFFMAKQPFVFALITQPYDVAKAKYSKFENFKYVQRGAVPMQADTNLVPSIFSNTWRLSEVKEDMVEIILYQDKPRDEFQVIINGVAMLPIGFPLSAVCAGGTYNIAKQVFRPYGSNFALGKSFVSSGAVKEISALIDEMTKLFVLKTRKSLTPAYINTSSKVISARVLSPGRISMGIPPDALVPIGQEGQGVTVNEFQILKELSDRVDKSTISNQFAGQQGHAGTTATEVVELQRQAKLVLGLTIVACSLLEKKLGYLRLWNIIANWYKPVGTVMDTVDGVRKEIETYRNTVRKTAIEGEGTGLRQVIPVKGDVPTPEDVRKGEIMDEKRYGYPIRRIYISADGIQEANLRWHIVVNPREKETSAFYKLLFREELSDVLTLMQLGSQPNVGGLEDEFAKVYQKDKSKIFSTGAVGPNIAGVSPLGAGTGAGGGQPSPLDALRASKAGKPATVAG